MIRFKRQYKFLVGCSFDGEPFLNELHRRERKRVVFFRTFDNATMQIMSPFVSGGEERTHQAQQRANGVGVIMLIRHWTGGVTALSK